MKASFLKAVSPDVLAGASVSSKLMASVYDIQVLMVEIPFIFKCPLSTMKNFYTQHLSGNHLEVGVGTGYFPDKCPFPVDKPTLHLMDLNGEYLGMSAQRVGRYDPISHQCDVLEPVEGEFPTFDSIGAMNLLHCLPGSFGKKSALVRNLKPFLAPGGVFFGATVLGQGGRAGPLARLANGLYNRLSIFSNGEDSPRGLEWMIRENFSSGAVEVVGGYGFFWGRV